MHPMTPFLATLLLAPTAADVVANPDLFLKLAAETLSWKVPAEPVRIAGPLYFVGTKGLGVYLLSTSDGLILINTGMPGSGPMIAESILKLGFRPEDLRIIIANHGHIDHVGGHAWLQAQTGAKVMIMAEDADTVETGGAADFFYGNARSFRFDPVKVDRRLQDNDLVTLGDTSLRAVRMGGHSKGAASLLVNIRDGAQIRKVLFVDGAGINPGYRLVDKPSYPGIASDYRRGFTVLEALTPDIWLSGHTSDFGFEDKRRRAATEGTAAWVDADGYRRWVAEKRAAFDARIKAEQGGD